MIKRSQKGIGLLELILAFTIIVVLLGMVLRYYTSTKSAAQTANLKEEKGYLTTGFERWANDTNKDFSELVFTDSNLPAYLPKDVIKTIASTTVIDTVDGTVYFELGDKNPTQFVVKAVVSSGSPATLSEEVPIDTCHAFGLAYMGSMETLASGTDGCFPTASSSPATGKFQYTFVRQ